MRPGFCLDLILACFPMYNGHNFRKLKQPNATHQNRESGKEVAKKPSRCSAGFWLDRIYRPEYAPQGSSDYTEVPDGFARIQHGGRREAVGLGTNNRDSAAPIALVSPSNRPPTCLPANSGSSSEPGESRSPKAETRKKRDTNLTNCHRFHSHSRQFVKFVSRADYWQVDFAAGIFRTCRLASSLRVFHFQVVLSES
jgi:hypothetical protein